MTDARARRVGLLINDLRNIGPTSDAKIKFIIDKSPLDDQGQSSSSSGDWTIEGRLLPNSNIYAQGSIQTHIILPPAFPFQPPKIIFLTKVYHPNVGENGEVSIDLVNQSGSWTPKTSLVSVVEQVTGIIDKPSLDMIQNAEAAHVYDTNPEEYEKIASSTFNSNCSPRN